MKNQRKNPSRHVVEALEDRSLLSNSLLAVSISDGAAYEGNSGNSNMTFEIDLNAPAAQTMSVQYETVNGTAKAGTDYVYTSGLAYFNFGDMKSFISVPVIGNTRIDGNRAFTVQLSNSFSASIARGTGTGTIVDDDFPAVKISAVKPTASANGPVDGSVRISRSVTTNKNLKVLLTVAGTARPGIDYTKLASSAVILAGKAYVDVPIKPIAASAKVGTRTVIVTIKPSSTPTYVLGSVTKATVNITNKETVPPSAKLTSNPGIPAASASSYQVTAVYTDNSAMSLASIATGNLRVTGPNSYSLLATLVSKKISADGKSVTAIYSIPAPGGSWDASDDGTYTILVVASQIKDTAGNSIVPGGLGTFAVTV